MPIVQVNQVSSDGSQLIMNKRAIADMISVYKSPMFINEKNYTMRLIENLHKMGYYRNIETIFTI